jgi:hypothetical protein
MCDELFVLSIQLVRKYEEEVEPLKAYASLKEEEVKLKEIQFDYME